MRFVIVILFTLCVNMGWAQDTLSLTLKQTDSLFLSNNLMLLAAKYKVDGQTALIQQAKIWDNPTLSTEWNLYNPQKDQFFDIGSSGQKIVGIDQVISIAGKRNKQIALAKSNAQLSQFEFDELMRTLKTEVHKQFYSIYFNGLTLKKYNNQLGLLSQIINALQVQSDKGNIPLNELMRIKALYYQLNNERTDLVSSLIDAQQELSTLLRVSVPINANPVVEELDKYNLDGLKKEELIAKALTNRPDLKITGNMFEQTQLNIQLQKRTNFPDLHIGAVYDQAGSYVNNYTGITLGFDLPVWNRNQGNIKFAKALSNQAKLELENKQISVTNEVLAAYQKLILIEQEYERIDEDFDVNLEQLNNGFVSNFQKRNISMIEFTDFVEAYNNSIQQLNNLKEKRIEAYEELNYVIGEEMFH